MTRCKRVFISRVGGGREFEILGGDGFIYKHDGLHLKYETPRLRARSSAGASLLRSDRCHASIGTLRCGWRGELVHVAVDDVASIRTQ